MTRNLTDLNNHLFAQLERLGDETLSGDALAAEVERSKAISGVAKDVIKNAELVLEAKALELEYGGRKSMPALLGVDSES